MASEGIPTYVPWLGQGWKLMEAIGNALPKNFWEWRLAPFVHLANQLRLEYCLIASGYTLEEIRDIVKQQTGRTINIEGDIKKRYEDIRGQVYRGEVTQDELIAHCARRVEQYGAFITPEIVAGGRPIPTQQMPPAPPPDTYSTAPPVVVDQPQAPPSGPASRPPPSGSQRTLDPISLIGQLLTLYQRWLEWRRSRQGAGTIQLQIPAWPVPPVYVRPAPGVSDTTNGGFPFDMAYVNTSVFEGGGGLGGLLNTALQTAGAIWGPNQASPGGANFVQQATTLPSIFDLPLVDIVPQGAGSGCTALQSAFATGTRRARAKIHVRPDPQTGTPVWFRPAGRPILWSSDLSACRRVRKVAARARRARGGR